MSMGREGNGERGLPLTPPLLLTYSTLTITLESLSKEAIEQGATMAAECRSLVVVHLELVRYVDVEPP